MDNGCQGALIEIEKYETSRQRDAMSSNRVPIR